MANLRGFHGLLVPHQQRLRKAPRRKDRRSLFESLEARRLLDASGFSGNDCPPDLDLSAISTPTVTVGDTIALNLPSLGGTLTDVDSGGSPTGDTLRWLPDPDTGVDFPAGATLSPQGLFTWTPTSDQVGENLVWIIGIDSGNPALADAETLSFTVLPSIDPTPTIDLNGPASGDGFAATFTEGDSPTLVVSTDLSVVDADSSNLSGATATFSPRPDGADESLSAVTAGTPITAAYSAATGQLTLSGTATVEEYQQVLRTLTYNNVSQNPGVAQRTVSVTVTDGVNTSAPVDSTVTVVAVNEAPNLDAIADRDVVVGNEIVVTVTASDPDGDSLTFALDPDNSPPDATIVPTGDTTAEVRWTPQAVSFPGAVDFLVLVTDSGSPGLSDSEGFEVTVHEENVSPSLEAIADQAATVGQELVVPISATDANNGQTLTFLLDSDNTPAGATITQTGDTTAEVRWTPSASDAPGPTPFVVLVIDNGFLPLTDSEAFEATVSEDPGTVVLSEGFAFSVAASQPVALGQSEGTRTVAFDIEANLDTSDTAPAVEDLFQVFLVDSADASSTLLDNGVPGTAVFSLAGDQAEYTPGLVRYDGSRVEIDVTSLGNETDAELVFQLINSDADEQTRVVVTDITNSTDTDALPPPRLALATDRVDPGAAIDVSALAAGPDLTASIQNVRYNQTTGVYDAEIVVRNDGAAVGRQLAAVFAGLPASVTLSNASGSTSANEPYLNLTPAVPSGGLLPGQSTRPVPIRFNNPADARFSITPTLLSGGANSTPTLSEIAPLTAVPGDFVEVLLDGQDADGDHLTYTLSSSGPLPGGMLAADGRLVFAPTPDQLGVYDFTVSLTDGAETVMRTSSITVEADPLTTTRFSGTVLDTNEAPLVGMVVEIRDATGVVLLSTLTDASGGFFLESVDPIAADTVVTRGDLFAGPGVYPYVAEKLPLVLGREVFDGANNEIGRPIYLPVLNVDGGSQIDPAANTTVQQELSPGDMAAVFVEAGTLLMDDGNGGTMAFDGTLSITEVPTSLTPAALPPNLVPDTVVTIQPGDMMFTSPAELSLPNRAGFAPGTVMDLWSINPLTGDFDDVGEGRVSADGSMIETVEGGIRNSSWHFFVPEPQPEQTDPNEKELTQEETCPNPNCKATAKASSRVELHSGALEEFHDLATYQSLGQTRGVQLYYNSLNADPRPILHFGYDNLPANDQRLLVAELEFTRGDFMFQVPGFAGGLGLNGGEHFWSIPDAGGEIEAALQADMSMLPTGVYDYTLRTGLFQQGADGVLNGAFNATESDVTITNTSASEFGAGWTIAGQQTIVENPDGSVLLLDGGGTRQVFELDPNDADAYLNPPADFSTLEKLGDGTFRRTTTDQMVYVFNDDNQLSTVTDRNGRVTEWRYDAEGRLTTWVDPAGLETTFNYTDAKVSSIVDPAGRVTTLTHDAAGNLTSVTDPDGATRTFGYDASHRLTSEIDARGFLEESFYNFAGRVVRAELKDGATRDFMPAQTQVLLPPTDTIDPNAAPSATSPKDAMGMFADQNGSVVEVNLNRFGQSVTSVDPEGSLPRTSRDANNLITITGDGRGNVTSYEYDEFGNVVTIRDTITGTGDALLSNAGTEFWLAFQGNDVGGEGFGTQSLFIASELSTNGTVEIAGLNFSEQFTVEPGQITTVTLPFNASIRSSDQIEDLGVRVATEGPVSVYGMNQQMFTTDGFLALPVDTLGFEHIVMSSGNGLVDGTQFAVVAVEDGTEVTITPSVATDGRAAGVPYTLTLDRGQAYQLTNDQNDDSDLTGTVITSSAAVAVFSGHRCGNVPTDVTFCDHLVEQLPPTSTWGQAFVTAPLATRQMGDTFRVLAATADTEVFIGDNLVATLGRGEFFETILTDASVITTSKPALVAQFSNGTNFDGVTGDPFMALVPPFEQFTNSYTVTTPAQGIANNFINVVAPTSAVGSIRLDGVAIADDQFTAIAGTDFSAAQVPVTVGTHTLDSVLNFGVLIYGFDQADSYGYLGGQAFSPAASQSFTYDATFNQLTSFTDELGRQTLYDIDATTGNRLSMRRVVGEIDDAVNQETNDLVTSYTYTTLGLVDTMTDPLGRVTDYDYDTSGRLTRVTLAVGTADEAFQAFEYDAVGNQTAVVDENGNRTEFAYDAVNRLTLITEPDPDGAGPLTAPVTSFTYDTRGNLLTTTDARGNVTTNEYDPMSRLARTIDADDEATTFAYDEAGNLAGVTDPLGFTTQNVYDGRNRLIETTDPEGGVTRFAYDTDDNLVSVVDPVGNETRFRYDARDRLVQETDPLGEVTSYTYDATDNLIGKTDRNGRATAFAYDEIDRLVAETWLDTDGATPLNTIDYAYDEAGNLLSVVDAYSALAFTYDARDRVDTVDNDGTPNTPRVVLDYGYDGVGNVTSVADTIDGVAGATTGYAYDALNRTTTIQQSGADVSDKLVDFVYNELGQFDEIARYSDLGRNNTVAVSDYEYDELNRLTDLDHTNAADEVLAFYDFEYDPSSRITRITDIDGVTDYTYDDRSQLTGADRDAADLRGDESYAYDANGNRTDSHLHGGDYATGAGNRLLSDGAYNYEYDAEGNTTRRTEIATGEYREFEWDHRNRLVSVTDFSAGGVITQAVEYAYDVFDRRIEKTVDADGAGPGGEVSTLFVYDREDVLLDFVDLDGSASTEAPALDQRYLHGPGIDQVLAQQGDQALWLLADHLGTIRDVVSGPGVVLNHITYDSFGQVLALTNTAFGTRYLFTGREYDFEVDLQYSRARYYDASSGRFISEDPLRFGSSDPNLFRYTHNSPLLLLDPYGLDYWIEGPGPGEPQGHWSINVGDPNGENVGYSFGVDYESPFWRGGLRGGIYRDQTQGGNIRPGYYRASTPEEDAMVIEALNSVLGTHSDYNIGANCRSFSEGAFDVFDQRGIGRPATPIRRFNSSLPKPHWDRLPPQVALGIGSGFGASSTSAVPASSGTAGVVGAGAVSSTTAGAVGTQP
ncbi:MAG: RHS repeat-associated core domain-containing protein [Planctomycetota bacterium]